MYTLALARTPVTDLSPLVGLTGLRTLNVIGTAVSELEADRLQAALPGLQIVR